MKLVQRFMRFFFHLLYHPFAFAYDLVAATVSFGRWNDWVSSVFPLIEGTRILELGHGPGHLQRSLLGRGLFTVAMDESRQMGRLAKRRIGTSHKLTRGIAQSLPYPHESFDSVVATFPSEYIFDARTLSETHRVLRNGGRLIALLAAWPKSPLLAWLFKVTGESPDGAHESIKFKIKEQLAHSGFAVDVDIIEVKSSHLLVIKAQKE
ncbi:MAG: methyltransferase domain-containing protein [Anaerolineales bacterium]|nr:MAG: methyltransferase domain-containing protein [Anaerolineales bacterium]